MNEKLHVRYPVIVEGRYDKSKLSSIIDADIITTDGFGIFSDPEKLKMIRELAKKDSIIILTDSDTAGFRIRNHILSAVPADRIVNVYIPEIMGKEHRKSAPSAEGMLGVEGVPADILRKAFEEAGVLDTKEKPADDITKAMLYELGYFGKENSSGMRKRLLERLDLPKGIGSNSLAQILSRVVSIEDLAEITEEIR